MGQLRHKARLVAQGYTQTLGLDCFDTFSPVIKLATIRIVLTLTASLNWPVNQLEFNNAFLMVHYKRMSTCLNHRVLRTNIGQLMCVSSTRHCMGAN